MSYYRGLTRIAGSGSSPYIDNNGEWAVLGHSLGVRAKGQLCQITVESDAWSNKYVEDNSGYRTIEVQIDELPDNVEVTSVKLSGTDVSDIVNNTENLNGTLVGATVKNGKIIVIQKGYAPKGQVTIDVYLDTFVKTGTN